MRPLELRLRNFRSFHGTDHKINFRGRRLVGVVGPIGSGKSTILDAIAFALYGRTARSGAATKSLIHQSRSINHAAVSLRFEHDGDIWEAARLIRRKGSAQHHLKRLETDCDKATILETVLLDRAVTKRVVTLLGVDFEGFGRTAMLAQGQFAEFLQASPAQRDSALKGVFGYDRVGVMHERARYAAREAEHEIDKLDIRLEHAEAARVRLDERRSDLGKAEQRLATVREALPLFHSLADRIAVAQVQATDAEHRLAALHDRSGELPDPDHEEPLLAHAATALIEAGTATARMVASQSRLDEAQSSLASDEVALGIERVAAVTKLLLQLEADNERRRTELANLRGRTSELPLMGGAIRTVSLAQQSRDARIRATLEHEEASARLAAADAAMTSPDADARRRRVREASTVLTTLGGRETAAEQTTDRQTRLACEADQADLASVEFAAELHSASALHATARADADIARGVYDDANAGLHDARHAEMATTLRGDLLPGVTCPVCEQHVSQLPPAVEETGAIRAAKEAVAFALSASNAAAKRRQQCADDAHKGATQLATAQERASALHHRLHEARQDHIRCRTLVHKSHRDLVEILGVGDAADLLAEQRAVLDGLETSVAAARQLAETRQLELNSAQAAETRAGNMLSDLRARVGALRSSLQAGAGPPAGEPDAVRRALEDLHTDWRDAIAHLEHGIRHGQEQIDRVARRRTEEQAAIDDLRTEVEHARAALDCARIDRDAALSAKADAHRHLSDLRARVGRLAVLVEDTIDDLPPDDPASLGSSLRALRLGWDRAIVRLRREEDEHRSTAQTAIRLLEDRRAELAIDGTIDAAVAEANARKQQIEADIARDESLIASAAEMLRLRADYESAARINQRLMKDLTNSRFVRFLLDEERAVLAALASEPFASLSSGRYRFSDNGVFDVVDLAAADSVRRADSLSGGETFLASLALALGLAEMIGRRSERLNAFFLDEGFGTLDPEHLDLAMKGVEALVTNNGQRLVVVVSHMPELRQRMDDLIVLDKDPVTGHSRISHGGSV